MRTNLVCLSQFGMIEPFWCIFGVKVCPSWGVGSFACVCVCLCLYACAYVFVRACMCASLLSPRAAERCSSNPYIITVLSLLHPTP